MSSNFEIGMTVLSKQDLETLGLPNPHPVTFKPYARRYTDGHGRPRGDGYAIVTWHFDALTHAQLQTMLGVIGEYPGGAAVITTRTDFGADYDASFTTFSGFLTRPEFGDNYNIEMGRTVYTNLTFEFTMLEEVT